MGWWIVCGIVLLIVVLLSLSIAVDVRFTDEFTVSAGILGWRYQIFPAQEKPDKPAPKKAQAKSRSRPGKKKSAPKAPQKPEKGDIKGTFQTVIDLLQAAFPPLMQLLGQIRLTRLDAVIQIGGENAADIALEYGKICALFSGGLATLQNMLRVKVKRVDISCDFLLPETRQDISFRLKLRIAAILWAALRIGGRFLVHTMRREQQAGASASPSK